MALPHIVLVGPMGSGKTTVGRALAARLGRRFRDGDEELEARFRATAREIADDAGLDELHRREAAILRALLDDDEPTVISPAASVVDDPAVRRALRPAHVVWLQGDDSVLAHRTTGSSHRPAIPAAMAGGRRQQFAAVADRVVDAVDLDAAAVVEVIAAEVDRVDAASLRLLGGCGSAALVDECGQIVWWCAPEAADPPILWRLLEPVGGVARWLGARRADVSPGGVAGPVLHTAATLDGAPLELRDAILRRGDDVCIVRLVRTPQAGPVEHELVAGGFEPSGPPPVRHRVTVDVGPGSWGAVVLRAGPDGVRCQAESAAAWLDEVAQLEESERERDRRVLVPGTKPERTRDALAVLSACADPRSGGVLAAPTTSIPEAIGGNRQWDYRFTWLRDASMATSVAVLVGDPLAGELHLRSLHQLCTGDDGLPPPVRQADGSPVPDEREVAGRASWGGSKPVRVGNDARAQVQLDAYGEIAEALWLFLHSGGRFDRATWHRLRGIADAVLDVPPRQPSHGIWELRTPADLTSADIGRWLLHDRAARISWVRAPLAFRLRRRWRRAADEARARVVAGLRPDGSLPQRYDDPTANDAAALLAVVFGLLGRRDPRAHALVDRTLQLLADPANPVLVRRYDLADDGFEGREGAFVPVSWWAVAALAVVGRVDEARERAEALCALLPRLQPEEMDAATGRPLGNLPLVWSHMECARALYLIDSARIRGRFGAPGLFLWRAGRHLRLRARRRRVT